MRPYRPRISILTALLLMTILGMAIVIAQLWREVGPIRAEVPRLRDEVGALSIGDPSEFHAIRVRTNGDYVWKWRIWVPEGREYQLKIASENIPKNDYPQNDGMIFLNHRGESWIEYRIAKDPHSDNWMGKLTARGGSVGSTSQAWVTWKQRVSSGDGVSYKSETKDPGKPIILARERVSEKVTDSAQIEDPSADFMIWLEPTK